MGFHHHFLVQLETPSFTIIFAGVYHHPRGIPSWERSHITNQGTFQSMIFRLSISVGYGLVPWRNGMRNLEEYSWSSFWPTANSSCQKHLEHQFPVRRKFFIFFWLWWLVESASILSHFKTTSNSAKCITKKVNKRDFTSKVPWKHHFNHFLFQN